jgi:UDP-N-acetylglucosamine 2-epimerase (non-hydrolysing)
MTKEHGNLDKLRVLVILGTRPEAIKLAPVIKELRRYPGLIATRVCVTGQHREMLDQTLQLFDVAPDVDLDVMRERQTPSQVAALVLIRLESVLLVERPDWVLVQGDTTTVMAAAIAAYYRGIKIAHVEAGLRSHDKCNPFPEEMNRVITDHLSDLHFAPTLRARDNLLREGISEETILVTGNTVIDALLDIFNRSWRPGPESPLSAIPFDRRLILVTAHRRENFGVPLRRVCAALREIAVRDGVHIVYPVHMNPNVWQPVHEMLTGVPGITLLPPLDYQSLIYVMKRSYLILTDSGGIQEEAPSLGVPVLVLRKVTERPEAVEAGAARIVGTDIDDIVGETVRLLENAEFYESMAKAINPYGDGHAADRIVTALLEQL